MNLRTFRESVLFEDGHSYDLVIAASGYETRARYFAETYSDQLSQSANKIVLGFAEHASACARSENDKTFAALGYRAFPCGGGAHHEVLEILRKLFTDLCVHAPVRILVDVSSMTRSWYGAVIRALLDLRANGSVAVTFAYSGADYSPPPAEYPANRVVGPVAGFTGNTLPDKPTALVIGLGYDKGRAIGLKDHLDPQLTVLFYADPAVDKRYVDQVRQINAQLIGEVGDGRLLHTLSTIVE